MNCLLNLFTRLGRNQFRLIIPLANPVLYQSSRWINSKQGVISNHSTVLLKWTSKPSQILLSLSAELFLSPSVSLIHIATTVCHNFFPILVNNFLTSFFSSNSMFSSAAPLPQNNVRIFIAFRINSELFTMAYEVGLAWSPLLSSESSSMTFAFTSKLWPQWPFNFWNMLCALLPYGLCICSSFCLELSHLFLILISSISP